MDNDQNYPNSTIDDSQRKKIMHRDIERKRRQEMAALFQSLRSALPLQSAKGKRSLVDNMNVAVNYIKNQQARIKELGDRRDELMMSRTSSSSYLTGTTALGVAESSGRSSSSRSSAECSTSRVAVNPCLGGVEIVIRCGGGGSMEQQGAVLSRLLQILLEQRLTVISCATTQVNQTIVYTIQSEVSDPSSIDLSGLEQNLNKYISSLICFTR